MNFRLEKKSTGPTLTKFFVYDSTGATVGIITVGNEQAEDLQSHWRAPQAPPAKAAGKAAAGAAAIIAALRKGPRLSKEALLRGS